LQNLGYAEGRNIELDVRFTDGQRERAAQFAAELVAIPVDVIVAHLTPAVRAAIAATRTIPIVMAPAGGPLQSGLIESLSRPGGNVTGLSNMDAELGGKKLGLLRELIPNLQRVAVLAATPATDPFSVPFVEDLRSAASQAGLQLEPELVGNPTEFNDAFATMDKNGAQAVVVQGFFDTRRVAFLELAAKYLLGAVSVSRETTTAGGLLSVSADYLPLYERAAIYVDKILKGGNPATLPVEQPTRFEVIINLKTARSLGLTISPTLLAQMDEVIE
jgi:putative tryptophan/tyrosine transport system substrate-binding protein